jgi:hypothetical protein
MLPRSWAELRGKSSGYIARSRSGHSSGVDTSPVSGFTENGLMRAAPGRLRSTSTRIRPRRRERRTSNVKSLGSRVRAARAMSEAAA